MTKGIIYYTDNRLSEPIFSTVQQQILRAKLPITSVSLSPINFGNNIVLDLKPSYITMVKQITTALENNTADIVFFSEHDVLYPQSHFEFTPVKDNIFYYNSNVWRWAFPTNQLITYDRLISLSGLSVNRLFALNHYKERLKKIIELQGDDDTRLHEPLWARRWGYEPGTKKIKRGGFSDDDFETWKSIVPIIDIRHGKTFSQSKVTIESFIHKPENWQETTIEKIDGWKLKELFKL
ncbi:MAG: hypothetical protein WA152_01000 [Microgenomates group bacterium]